MRQNYSSDTPWERLAGYSRAVRVGPTIWVSGTTASDAMGRVHGEDAAAQARYILRKIESTLRQAGADLSHVVRTRVYVARLEDWEAVARVHGEFFDDIRPANTLIQAAGLVDGRLVDRSRRRRRGLTRLRAAAEARIERIAHAVANEVERQQRDTAPGVWWT